MTTATLYPGAVFSYADPDDPGAWSPATVVGTGEQWADGSDATYATSDGSAPPTNSMPAAFFDAVADLGTLNTASLFIRYSTTPNGLGNHGLIFDVMPVSRFGTGASAGFPTVPADDGIHEMTVPIVNGATSSTQRAAYAAAITAGVEIGFLGWASGPSLTVYETHLIVDYVPAACYTVDLPAYGVLAPYSGTREDTLATPDTSTEIVVADGFQDIAVGTYGTAYDSGANVVLPTIPSGMEVTDAHYVTIAYRESGSDITEDTSGWGYTPRGPLNEPFLYLDSSARSGRYLFDNLPIGGYAGELVSEFAESLSYLQLDHPLNRAWLSYSSGSPPPIHVAYLAIRLTICPIVTTVAPPCQIYPRDDGRGVGGPSVWPPPSSARPGSYY